MSTGRKRRKRCPPTRTRYAPRRFRRGRKKRGPMPILPLVGLAPPIMNLVNWVGTPLESGDLSGAAYNGAYSLMKDFTGYDLNEKRWTGGNMLSTYSSILLGYIGHIVANKLGANRAIRKVPVLGKWVQL